MIVRTFTTWALILPVLVAGDDFLKDYRRLRSREVKTAAAMHFERTLEDAANVKPLEADAFFRLLQADTSMTPAPTRAPTRAPTNPPVPGATLAPTPSPTFAPTSAPITANPTPTTATAAPTTFPTGVPVVFDGTIVDFVIATPTLSALLAAVVRAGLVEGLSGPGPFTLFAPTNNAFTTVPDDIRSDLFTNDEFLPHLRDLLLYHVLLGEFFAADLVASTLLFSTLTTANEETVTISTDPLSVNGIAISDGDNAVSNGVVHLINTGVLTPSWVSNTLVDRVNSASDLSTLGTLLVAAGIDLSIPPTVTLLAPTNDAFAALPQDTIDFLTDPANVAELVRVLAYHVVMGIFTEAELTPGQLMTFGGNLVTVTLNPIRFNTAGVIEFDILARNGVLHKIDEVLEPPSLAAPTTSPTGALPFDGTIVDFVIATPTLSTLLAAVSRAQLVDGLSGTGPLTLFAPTNNAFTTVPADIVNLLFNNDEFIPHLRDLLLYHVLLGEFFAADLVASTLTTANEETVTISLNPLSVNGIAISDGDNDVSNGVVHLIDTGVLTPSWVSNTLVDRVNSASDLSTLGTLLVAASIDLSVAGNFTLLAPTNDAFAALPQDTIDFLTDPINVAELVRVLAYHVLVGVFTSSELTPGPVPTFIMGGTVAVSLDPIRFNTAGVVELDILARNGVLHKIDQVLEPPTRDTIIDFINATPELSTLLSALERAGFADGLSGAASITLFAPTNNAFTTVPANIQRLLFENDAFIFHLQDLLLYHILNAELFAADFADGDILTAFNGENVTISLAPLRVNGIAISNGDNDVSNGVVHLIDTGVLTPSWVSRTIADRVNSASDLSTLASLLVLSSIDLSGAGNFTLLAPTNDAFAALPQETLDFLTDPANVSTLIQVLAYHLLPGVIISQQLMVDGQQFVTFEGRPVVVSLDPIMFNNAGVVEFDILANNGVLHKIDAVLEFTVRIIEFIRQEPTLAGLTVAVERAGFSDALAGPGPLSLFAPTDDALAQLPANILPLLFTNDAFIPHLRVFLLYHLLGGEVFAADFTDGQILTTLSGETVTATLAPVRINGIEVSQPDNDVSNGVVHIINANALTPSWVTNSIADRVASNSELSTLGALLTSSGINLSGPGAITLLAPTNDAFAALGQDTLDFLTNPDNIDDLRSVLSYHAIPGVLTLDRLSPGQQLPTFEGRAVTVSASPLRFNNAGVVAVNILTNNGVVHIIDAVLEFSFNLVAFVESDPELSTLLAALERAGFRAGLSGAGTFTLFTPVNSAFSALPAGIADLLFNNDEFIPHLQVLLLNHLIESEIFSGDFVAGPVLPVSGETLAVTLNPLRVQGALVTSADNDVSNGVAHKIDGVLSPSWVANSLADRVSSASDLSVLFSLLTSAGIDLSVSGAFTLLAPTNDAFALLPAETVAFLTDPANIDDLVTLLTYHVVVGVFTTAELTPGRLLTLQGRPVTVTVSPLRFNNAGVEAIDILANNGVLHKLNEVLELVGPTIFNLVAEDPELTLLEAAILRSSFRVGLSSPGPFTLFAPTDDAFGLLPADLANTLFNNNAFLPHLQALLLYHLIPAEVFSTSLVAGPVTVLNGESVTIGLNPITVNGIAVSGPDIDATNGVVHKIDGVLTPSWVTNNLLERVLNDARISIVADLVERVDSGLGDPGEFTFLAATNAAFEFISPDLLETLRDPANAVQLLRIIEYNTLVGIQAPNDFTNGPFATKEGNTINVSVINVDGNVSILFNDAMLVSPALLANNGIYYFVDAFLSPPSLRVGGTEMGGTEKVVQSASYRFANAADGRSGSRGAA
jgi:transforming growth factor-beta-induced protein